MHTASQILENEFLEVRAKLLEVAATLDRVDRSAAESAPLDAGAQSSRDRIDAAIQILLDEGSGRAERLQRFFSREYEKDWRREMEI
ncbi:hypothetical protein N9D23_01510 [Rubripirellula sp.]|jgi:hypothetical protein|nr:hypothetical protein [Planctomycetaceae bacterium]MDA9856773.1 hypothetical protein [Rubripirellula sp.]MDF1841358.1 hypothetical protein [Rubripirellula sp.]